MSFLYPVSMPLKQANAFIEKHHRHRGRVAVHLFSIGVADHHDNNRICGVAVVARPVARMIDGEFTAEISRLCVDGTPNAASFLLARAAEAAFAIGYIRLITYTLQSEAGTSLRAAAFLDDGVGRSGRWDHRPGRQQGDCRPKRRWYRLAPWFEKAVKKANAKWVRSSLDKKTCKTLTIAPLL